MPSRVCQCTTLADEIIYENVGVTRLDIPHKMGLAREAEEAGDSRVPDDVALDPASRDRPTTTLRHQLGTAKGMALTAASSAPWTGARIGLRPRVRSTICRSARSEKVSRTSRTAASVSPAFTARYSACPFTSGMGACSTTSETHPTALDGPQRVHGPVSTLLAIVVAYHAGPGSRSRPQVSRTKRSGATGRPLRPPLRRRRTEDEGGGSRAESPPSRVRAIRPGRTAPRPPGRFLARRCPPARRLRRRRARSRHGRVRA